MLHLTSDAKERWRATVIKGNVDISFVTQEALDATRYAETTSVGHANGLWEEMDVLHPEYPEGSDIIYQSFGDQCPQWAHDVSKLFTWVDHKQITINKIMPGRFIPPHKDKMYKMRQYLDDANVYTENKELVRITIFLQDHKIGHWLNIDNHSYDNYSKGDYTYIFPEQLHVVGNLGNEPRYTMQVTGLIDYRAKI